MIKVIKFGGTSISNEKSPDIINNIINKILEANTELWIVFSAFSKVTDLLHKLIEENTNNKNETIKELRVIHVNHINNIFNKNNNNQKKLLALDFYSKIEANLLSVLDKKLDNNVKNQIISVGEIVSTRIYTWFLGDCHNDIEYVTTPGLIINTSNNNMLIDYENSFSRIKNYRFSHPANIYCVTGYISSDIYGTVNNLGRGGSDLTATIIAASIKADEVTIFTDVDGIMSTDPIYIEEPKLIKNISYNEIADLSYYGANVIYYPTIFPALKFNIPIRIKNTFNLNCPGTIISSNMLFLRKIYYDLLKEIIKRFLKVIFRLT